MDVIGLNSPDHILHQLLASHVHASDRANPAQSIHDSRLAPRILGAKESNQADHSFKLDTLQALLQRAWTANFNDVVHALAIRGKLACRLAPVRVSLVVEHMVGPELLQGLRLLVGRGRGDDLCASSFGELVSVSAGEKSEISKLR